MATSYKDIRDAIKDRIAANWSATAIQWANTSKNPGSLPFIQPRVIFHGAESVSLGPQGRNRITADIHCTITYPIGAGDDEVMQRVDSFRDLFKGGYILPTASRSINFGVPEVREPFESEDLYRVPVFCPFWFDEIRS